MSLNQPQGRGSANKETGDFGEEVAADFLQRLGYTILARNYEFGRVGEIDIGARDGDVLVFCEVKARTNDRCGDPEYAITRKKQQQMRYLAKAYLYQHGIDEQECRFDVVAIRFDGPCPKIDYFKSAFL
jgi:putative endonuclease